MEKFLLGFAVGAVVCWLWCRRFQGAPSFDWFLRRELTEKHPAPKDQALENKVAEMEERLQTLCREMAAHRIVPENETPLQDIPSPGRAAAPRPVLNKRQERGNVLALWEGGTKVDEIATRTQLGKGEVELIINLRGKAAARRLRG